MDGWMNGWMDRPKSVRVSHRPPLTQTHSGGLSQPAESARASIGPTPGPPDGGRPARGLPGPGPDRPAVQVVRWLGSGHPVRQHDLPISGIPISDDVPIPDRPAVQGTILPDSAAGAPWTWPDSAQTGPARPVPGWCVTSRGPGSRACAGHGPRQRRGFGLPIRVCGHIGVRSVRYASGCVHGCAGVCIQVCECVYCALCLLCACVCVRTRAHTRACVRARVLVVAHGLVWWHPRSLLTANLDLHRYVVTGHHHLAFPPLIAIVMAEFYHCFHHSHQIDLIFLISKYLKRACNIYHAAAMPRYSANETRRCVSGPRAPPVCRTQFDRRTLLIDCREHLPARSVESISSEQSSSSSHVRARFDPADILSRKATQSPAEPALK